MEDKIKFIIKSIYDLVNGNNSFKNLIIHRELIEITDDNNPDQNIKVVLNELNYVPEESYEPFGRIRNIKVLIRELVNAIGIDDLSRDYLMDSSLGLLSRMTELNEEDSEDRTLINNVIRSVDNCNSIRPTTLSSIDQLIRDDLVRQDHENIDSEPLSSLGSNSNQFNGNISFNHFTGKSNWDIKPDNRFSFPKSNVSRTTDSLSDSIVNQTCIKREEFVKNNHTYTLENPDTDNNSDSIIFSDSSMNRSKTNRFNHLSTHDNSDRPNNISTQYSTLENVRANSDDSILYPLHDTYSDHYQFNSFRSWEFGNETYEWDYNYQ